MKKMMAVFIAVMMATMLLSGCTGSEKTSAETQPLKVAMDLKYPPFTGTDEKGNPEGLEVDIAYALGEYLGRDVQIVNTDFPMLITALDTGEVDIVISEMSVKEERKEKVDFSKPYMYDRTLALVNKSFAEKNKITDSMSEKDFFALDAKYIGLTGTISVTVPQTYGHQVEEITEIASGLMEINNGTADVLIGANSIIGLHATYPESTVIYGGIKDYSETAMAVKKGNTELLEKVNAFIDTMYADGGFYKTAGSKYDQAISEYLKDPSLGLNYIIDPPQ
jgi:polar amino acid transport system substrate-binding protein